MQADYYGNQAIVKGFSLVDGRVSSHVLMICVLSYATPPRRKPPTVELIFQQRQNVVTKGVCYVGFHSCLCVWYVGLLDST